MRRFDDRVFIITGAGGGLGRAYALFLAARGGRILVNDYGGDVTGTAEATGSAARVAAEILAAGGAAIADDSDVRDPDSGRRMVDVALGAWGRVDGVVNNAAATRGGVGIASCGDDDFLTTFDIHVGGAVRLARAVWPQMEMAGYGRIVNTSSDALWGAPTPTYSTAKGAIFGLSQALAAEASERGVIKVNTVMPSAWTRMTAGIPPGEFRDTVEREFPPERVAPMVGLLLHEDCPWNGRSFQIGGDRAAEIFRGVTRGRVSTGDAALDDLADHADAICDVEGWASPSDMLASVTFAVSQLEKRHGA